MAKSSAGVINLVWYVVGYRQRRATDGDELNVSDRTAAVAEAFRQGLVD